MSKDDSDIDLLSRWRGGDRQAGNDLIERHFARVKRFFETKVSEDHLVKDLLQKTLVRCMEKVDEFERRSSFYTFLYGIARNILFEHFRQQRRDERSTGLEEVPMVDLDPTPFSALGRHRDRKLLINVLRRLPADTQVIVELYFFEGLPAPQVAEAVGRPEGDGARPHPERAQADRATPS